MRTNLFLGALAGALAIPTVVTIWSERSLFTDYRDVPRMFEGFTPDNITVIKLSKGKVDEDGELVKNEKDEVERDVLALQKTVDGWAIGQLMGQAPVKSRGAPVNADLVVRNVLEHVEAIRRDDEALVAEDADEETLAEYELDDDTGLTIECMDKNGKLVAALVRGRTARKPAAGQDALRGFFVRRKGDQDIVLYEQDGWYVQLEARNWINRQVLPPTAAAEAVHIKLVTAEGTVEFKKDNAADTTWEAVQAPPDTGAVRQQQVDSCVGRVTRASVTDYVEPLPQNAGQRSVRFKQYGLQQPALKAEFALEDGTKHELSIGNKVTDKNEHYAFFSGTKFIVTVQDWVKTSIEVDPMTLFDTKAPEAGKETPDNGEQGDKKPDDGR